MKFKLGDRVKHLQEPEKKGIVLIIPEEKEHYIIRWDSKEWETIWGGYLLFESNAVDFINDET